MATSGQVTLHGRFAPGTVVRLVKVRDESVLRAEGGKAVATATVDEDGRVQFKTGVEVGGRYFICGHDRGEYREVRVRGNAASDDTATFQPPVGGVPVKTAGGVDIDRWGRVAAPEHESTPAPEVAPGAGQHQVPKGTVQMSDTPLGVATPVDGLHATPDAPERQDDATDGKLLQRSDTPEGVTTPIAKAPVARKRAARKSSGGSSKSSSSRSGSSKSGATKRTTSKRSK